MRQEFIEWFIAIIIATLLYIIVTTFFFMSYTVSGDSMYPTFENGDKVIVNKMSTIHHGEVIVFQTDKKENYVKRVIGIPGDNVEYVNDVLYINGKQVAEPYLQENEIAKSNILLTENFNISEIVGSSGHKTIPKNKYLVLGDNREISQDSRHFGLIEGSQIVGEVQVRYWPINTFHVNFSPQ